MFQVMTGDNWSEIARGLFSATGNGAATAIFFVSFQLIVALVLVNVVIAVLLDEFSKAALNRSTTASGSDESSWKRCPFVRLAETLSMYHDLDDLESRIMSVFQKISGLRPELHCLDTTGDQIMMDFTAFRAGVKSLGFIPPILISRDDWDAQVVAQHLCTDEGTLGLKGFTDLMKHSVRRFQTWTLNNAILEESDSWEKEQLKAMFIGVKGMLAEDQESARAVAAAGGRTVQSKDLLEEQAATDTLLKRLLVDMNKMNKKFEAVEQELSSISHLKSRSKRKLMPIETEDGKGPKEDTAQISREKSKPAESEGKAKGAEGTFIGRQAFSRRKETKEAAGGRKDEGGKKEEDRGKDVKEARTASKDSKAKEDGAG
eukprot:CAMPEP_0181335708 /NCGR_PEP_ID=MMETSP1101-20121128/26990_1 /TAXON_ID=46948 /ORGANISM="Rhodomonas abbreviata, Strain Caron Lab Isolate" /LENGTH=373 /DNA_ID=CAMNT_0023445875 /DNA_START=45 /DNA_END=1163 /DNA_ORIENTATION=-